MALSYISVNLKKNLVGPFKANVQTTISAAAEKISNATAAAFSTDISDDADISTTAKTSTIKFMSSASGKNTTETAEFNATATLFEAVNKTTQANTTTHNSTRTTIAITRSTTTEFPKYEDLPLDVISVDYPAPVANDTVPAANNTVCVIKL